MSNLNGDMELIVNVERLMQRIKVEHPGWYAEFEDIDPFSADRAAVQHLLERAPSEFATGYLCGIMSFRQQLAILTDRAF